MPETIRISDLTAIDRDKLEKLLLISSGNSAAVASTPIDRDKLDKLLSSIGVTFEEPELQPGVSGSLETIVAIVLVTKITLAVLAIWGSWKAPVKKVAGKRRYVFEHEVTTTTEVGTKTETIRVVEESAEALQEGIARRFAELFNFDVAAVLKAVTGLKETP
jgi:hypothetical protein